VLAEKSEGARDTQPLWSSRLSLAHLLPKPGARFFIVVGLTSWLGCVVLVSILSGVIPDRSALKLESRVKLAESIATVGSVFLRDGDSSSIRYSLESIVDQNSEIHAIVLELKSGGKYRYPAQSDSVTDDELTADIVTENVHVPLLQQQQHWGEVIVQFVSTRNETLWKQGVQSRWSAIAFISLLSFPLFYLFLGKVLSELAAGRVVSARDRFGLRTSDTVDNEKRGFYSDAHPESRSPITLALSCAVGMRRKDQPIDTGGHGYLNTLSRGGRHLLNLMIDILDISVVESRPLEVENVPCNCAEIAADVIRIMRSKAQEKSIDLSMEVLTAIPEKIVADPLRLRQILTNLVSNAIKSTDKGSITVQLSLVEAEDPAELAIAIDVIDSGIGISKAQQAKLFDAFSQANLSIAQKIGGAGLGLSICRQLANAMVGELSVSSQEGIGSTFRLQLPIRGTDFTLIEPEEIISFIDCVEDEQVARWDLKPARILVVDDGLENRQLLSMVLTDMNLEVMLAENGRQGIDTLLEQQDTSPIDLVFMDIQMPEMDGYEAVAEMRRHGLTLPIVALTANVMNGIEQKVLEAGFTHCVVKPIDLDKMELLLAELLGGEKKRINPISANSVLDQLPQYGVGSSQTHEPGAGALAENLNSDRATTCNAVSKTISSDETNKLTSSGPIFSTLPLDKIEFYERVEEFINRMRGQLEMLRAAINNQQYKDVAQIAYWLRGSGRDMGYAGFADVCNRLERLAILKNGNALEARRVLESYATRVAQGWELTPRPDGSKQSL
jgi:signal transduction histidine kinase/DNA-binding response OmpR family regulator/HPt (histidine-containing phosphotransfer) domain-containing protein